MSIFIYEDDAIQAQQLKNLVEEICTKQQIPYDFIEVTSRSESILEKLSQTTKIPIYFLDIEIKKEGREGLHVAQAIRQYDKDGIIVFVTTHSELAPISYQYMVSALTFIDKGLAYNERYRLFEQCLQHYAERNHMDHDTDDFIVENAHATVRVPFSDIEYVTTSEPHRLMLVLHNRIIHFYGTLKAIEAVDERLFRCHHSYIINKTKIAAYDSREKMLVLQSGKRIPVSRRMHRKVRELIKDEISCTFMT